MIWEMRHAGMFARLEGPPASRLSRNKSSGDVIRKDNRGREADNSTYLRDNERLCLESK